MLIPFFRTGTHTASNGVTLDYSREELQRRADAYNSQRAADAPVVIGHPKHDAPAYGWIRRLDLIGDTLFASADSINADFRAALDAGAYKHVSAKWSADGQLRHIGFLGGAAPAITGLPTYSYAASDQDASIEFSVNDFSVDMHARLVWIFDDVRRFAQGLREWIIEEKGIEVADRVASSWIIDSIKMPQITDTSSLYSKELIMSGQTNADLVTAQARIAELEQQLSQQKLKTEADQRRLEFAAALDGDEFKGKVTPAIKAMLITAFDSFRPGTVEYSANGEQAGTATEFTAKDFLLELARKIPVSVEFSAVAVGGAAPTSDDKSLSDDIAARANAMNGRG